MTKKKPTLTRREFIIGTATIIGSAVLAQTYRMLVQADILADSKIFMPVITKPDHPTATATATATSTATSTSTSTATSTATATATDTQEPSDTPDPGPTNTPAPISNTVVHIRHNSATNWNGPNVEEFYEAADQNVVNTMVQTGLQSLTGESSWDNIWNHLFTRITPGGYIPGQKIAIKVNFNNSPASPNTCSNHNSIIDALPQPVIGLLVGLSAAGVQNSDIVVFDASGRWGGWSGKPIPNYFRNPILAAFPGVQFVGRGDCSGVIPTTYGKDPSLTVALLGTQMQDRHLADLLFDATYLINMPILKGHSGDAAMPVTLGFKNHLGSIDNVYASSASDSFHSYIDPTNGRYNPNSNPMVTLYQNENVGGKTILTLGDGLFGAFGSAWVAQATWSVFGNQPANSLFFAIDPVAIDCVMADILRAEGAFSNLAAYDYLFCAEDNNLGICEGSRSNPGGDPFGNGYSEIDYVRQNIS